MNDLAPVLAGVDGGVGRTVKVKRGRVEQRRLRVLYVHVGNPIDEGADGEGPVIRMDTLTRGATAFLQKDVVNNVTTRECLAEHPDVEVRAVCFTERRSVRGLGESAMMLRALVRDHRADLVNVYWGATSGLSVTLASSVPVVVTFGGSDLLGNYDAEGNPTRSGRLSVRLSRLAARQASGVVVPSEPLRAALPVRVQRKCAIIPQGVDSSKFYPMDSAEARGRTGIGEEERVVLFFPGSTASWVKDPVLARDTFARVAEVVPGARLIEVMGVPHEELVYYYNAADALLLTSRHEGSNNSIKEALCCNLPVVSTDVGDARERLRFVTPSAVVAQRNPDALAASLIEILRSGARSNGADHIAEITLDAVTERLVAFYHDVLGR